MVLQRTQRRALIAVLALLMIAGTAVSAFLLLRPLLSPKEKVLSDNWDLVFGAEEPVLSETAQLYYGQVKISLGKLNKIDDQTGTATVTVTTPDMQKILDQVLAFLDNRGGMTDEQLENLAQGKIRELLQVEEIERVSATLDVQVRFEGGKWRIVSSEAWDKAIGCDLASVYREFRAQALGGGK